MYAKIRIILISLLVFFCFYPLPVIASDNYENTFEGNGTINSPYLIDNYNTLCLFRDLVNKGIDFQNCYFSQTANIDMSYKEWEPIGKNENLFNGIYDGQGYYISNILISENNKNPNTYIGLFGLLGGTVCNLGIESGEINGSISGAIAGKSVGKNSAILNCYNKAKIKGYHVGGIAGFFAEGIITGCWNTGKLEGEQIGGIVAEGGDVKLYGCYATDEVLAPSDVVSTTSYFVTKKELFSKKFVNRLNIETGLSQYLFANKYNISLKQWQLSAKSTLAYSDNQNYIKFFYFINYYFLLFVLLIIIIYYAVKFRKIGIKNIWLIYSEHIKAWLIICGCVAFFLDCALLNSKKEMLKIGNLFFIILVNITFLITVFITIKNTNFKKRILLKNILPICIIIVFVVLLELLQFNLIPKYDAGLYYGSLIKATNLFRLDLITYVGAFVCWKWAQGVSLLLAPLEFVLSGSSISIYIANTMISTVTLFLLYRLFREMYINISSFTAALFSAIFILCPYGIGLFTYFCMDWHITFFAVWLLYFVEHRNNLLISFCGYLLCFTKITGFIFYVFILLSVGLIELHEDKKHKTILKKIKHWVCIPKIFFWILPAGLFILSFLYGDHFTIQNFYGTYVSDSVIGGRTIQTIGNTFMQAFVFGFRWIFSICILLLLLFYRNEINKKLTESGKKLILCMSISSFAVLFLLCIYNGDAECPRYTLIFNLLFASIFPLITLSFSQKEKTRNIIASIMIFLLLIQTYWTIDPAIIFFSSARINTGKTNRYKLTISKDNRPGMNLGTDYGKGIEVFGDLFAYNLEHAFYDDLLQDMLFDISPDSETNFYVLDIIDYELYMCGSANRNYKIYWNTKTKKRTYNSDNKHCVYLNEKSITSQELFDKDLNLPDMFYLIVVSRIDESKAINSLNNKGYSIIYENHPENMYGKISIYGFEKN